MELTEAGRLLSGRYRLSADIGRGGMGVVWQARDELLNRDVAVKEVVWPPHFTEAEQQVACQRAVREAQMAGRLAHPNVVRIYDILEEDGHPWIIMELLPYQSLRDLVREEGPLTPARAARVGLGVLAALGAAHARGVLHRDVKPANILVAPDGRVVLTDFGIARAVDSPTFTTLGTLVGSPSYIAPERARGGQSTPAGDLWGLGACLYAAVEGHPPFERDAPLATLTAVVADDPEEAVHAGPLWPVISALLRKDPDERLDAAQTERLLREVAGNDEAAPTAPGAAVAPREPDTTAPREPGYFAAPASRRPRRPRRSAIALAALAGVSAVVTVVALALTNSPGRPAASPAVSSRSASHPAASPGTPSAASSGATAAANSSASPAPTPASGAASAPASSGSAGGSTSSGSAGYGALPAGYHRFTNSTGFSIGVPDGWPISHVGHYVYITDPANSGIFLLIDQSDTPQPDPLADWRQQAANRASSYPGYHLIRLESVSYPQAEKAADWEFTYVRDGILVHILNRNVLANAHHAYALYWSVPESSWNSYYHVFQAFAATFRPAQ
ncbi:serine/threonine protein kinase [Trebonia kvetii]|uniref:non-specific serine/threonine protein kinase n=1 Tax=Trebonia kvetii TaxID=2480626 RepID=A0A6P2C3F5_9ACTN|nr:serine/threonine-protein kinase [Trebonia kvetii]TVZ05487.1 serine/threonine protein kinase [Trebonia kvetii]